MECLRSSGRNRAKPVAGFDTESQLLNTAREYTGLFQNTLEIMLAIFLSGRRQDPRSLTIALEEQPVSHMPREPGEWQMHLRRLGLILRCGEGSILRHICGTSVGYN